MDFSDWEIVGVAGGGNYIGRVVEDAGDVVTLYPALAWSVSMMMTGQQPHPIIPGKMEVVRQPVRSLDPIDSMRSTPRVTVRWTSRRRVADYTEADRTEIERALVMTLKNLGWREEENGVSVDLPRGGFISGT